ncbi:hypothetical protein EWG10_07455 [Salmonella enterica subsp. enterica serovar Napoli]|nr:hypothetical protein LFZ26_04485 [Salmonella enterica subsp. enterica serovar Manchester str. ST278]EAW1741385.1 hypothetical protein [Salmonella enterica subsp. enterica]EAZ3141704.1 hypothetical protein [Salmonella enterica]EBX4280680.1 hypothetical protein [Salmonella enterica subsp. enterica serovar Napoli]ECC3380547.1 hypothetical protein [Salmonella enterica subsp. enterica serovar Manchester]EDE1996353.1 hypothetical protein [Salmonella enterica subsp. enterica serovar Hissar]
MLEDIKRYLTYLFKNIDKTIIFIVFMCTFSGAWFLFSFANTHNVKFIDLIQTNLLVSFGAFSFATIFFIIYIFWTCFFISPIISKFLYFEILTKEKIRKRKTRLKVYFVYFSLCGIISIILFHNVIIGILILLAALALFHFVIMQQPFNLQKTFKTLKLFIYTLLLLAMSYIILLLLSLTLNFEIAKTLSFNWILQTLFISFIIIILAGVGFADMHLRIRDIRNRIQYYLLFAVPVIFYIATAFSSGISEKIVDLTGLGYQYRCYYDTDLDQYSIPEEFIQDKFNNKTKLFIVADIDGKMYISLKDKHTARFYFTAKELSQVNCDK